MKIQGLIAQKIRFRGPLAVCAVALSFFVITVATAIAGGFREEIFKSLRDISGDIFVPSDTVVTGLEDAVDVERAVPVLYRPGVVKSGDGIRGVLFKGEPADSSRGALSARIPSSLASELNFKEGDGMLTYFVGEKLRARKFTVDSICPSVFESRESRIAGVRLEDLQRVDGPDCRSISGMEVYLSGSVPDRRTLRERAFEMSLDSGVYCQAVCDKYPNIFDWLDLIDVNVKAILALMITVAGFNMISGLLIMLFRNVPTIGLLKTLGMSSRGIAGVFLRVGARVVGLGLAAGNILALTFCLVQKHTGLIKLDAKNYFLSYVPVKLSAGELVLCDAAAFIAIMLILLLPCLFIAKTDPARTVKTK